MTRIQSVIENPSHLSNNPINCQFLHPAAPPRQENENARAVPMTDSWLNLRGELRLQPIRIWK